MQSIYIVLIVLIILFTLFLLIGVPVILTVINSLTQKQDCAKGQQCPENQVCRQAPAYYCDQIECDASKPCGEDSTCYNNLCYPNENFLDVLLLKNIYFKIKAGNNYVASSPGQYDVNSLRLSPTSDLGFSIGKVGKDKYYLFIGSEGAQENTRLVLLTTKDKKSKYQYQTGYLQPCQTSCMFNCQDNICIYSVPLNYKVKNGDQLILESSLTNVCNDGNCRTELEYTDQTGWLIKSGTIYIGYEGTNFSTKGSGFQLEINKQDEMKLSPLEKEMFKNFYVVK